MQGRSQPIDRRPRPTNVLFDYSAACDKLCDVEVSLQALRGQTIGEVSAF